MLWSKVMGIIFEKLEFNNVKYTTLEWTDTNETIVFLEKDNKIYTTRYNNGDQTFSATHFLINGFAESVTRNGDYITLLFVYNQKAQTLDINYTDLVAGLAYGPVSLWDGTVASFSAILTDDNLEFIDPWKHPLDMLPDVTSVSINHTVISWTDVVVPPTRYDKNTFYRLYEGDEMVLIADNLVTTSYTHNDIKPVTKYTVTRSYEDRWLPNPVYETDGAYQISLYEIILDGADANMYISHSITTPDDIKFTNITPITPPSNNESSTFGFGYSMLDGDNNTNGTIESFGLVSYNNIPKYLKDVEPENISNVFGNPITTAENIVFTNYNGSFII